MSNQSLNDAREATARLERELLTRMGLGSGASNEQIESAHEEIAGYLDKAPAGLRAWSVRQAASIDEAYALLRAPREELAAAAAKLAGAAPIAAAAALAPVSVRPVAAPAPNAPAGRHAMDALDDADNDDWLDEPDPEPAPRSTRSAAARRTAATGPQRRGINPMLRKAGIALAGIVVVAGIALGGYNLGAPKATPAPSAAASDAAFQAQVASLMQKLAADASDQTTLMDLANLYYTAGDYTTASTWIKKLLAIAPNSIDGLLALGATAFNLADYPTAEQSWNQVLTIDPANLEAYYDLGFLYFSDNPPNLEMTRKMWNKVIEISPDSQIAQTVASHLKSLDASASGSPAASAAPGSSPTAAPSSAPTPSPRAS